MNNNSPHTFHIPVMGLAYTIDTPIRLAHFGISSVVSITDDELIEKMRKFYSEKFNKKYEEISTLNNDYRAKRITEYLNLLHEIVFEKFNSFKKELIENKKTLLDFTSILPKNSNLKNKLSAFTSQNEIDTNLLYETLEQEFQPGAIDVNIMTKVDKENFIKNEPLSVEYNDAHASLRGFANSQLKSSVIFSAGMNPKLYSYLENFEDFYPNEKGEVKKKIVLKVSDYRSALIQGNFLAKKGLWVSEYRIESGLNCGGHAFATEGLLLGPILNEFKNKKSELQESSFDLLVKSLTQKNKIIPNQILDINITAQGGIGTAEEHDLLLNEYQLSSIGWGSPFLLVPEATSLDEETRNLLIQAQEKDFYLSNISPLGVRFNTVKGMSNDYWKEKRISENKAGSSCPKKFLALNREFDDQGLCTASKKYQDFKIEELETKKESITKEDYLNQKKLIHEKACLCVGLANSAFVENDIKIKGQEQGIVICPGPNLAYFNNKYTLSEMIKHIYGLTNLININRQHVFLNELKMYVEYMKKETENYISTPNNIKKWNTFKNNLIEGINYYKELSSKKKLELDNQLDDYLSKINNFNFI